MNREFLLQQLQTYRPCDEHETEMLSRIRAFVSHQEKCFDRNLKEGHLTGSAWVLDHDRTHALLTHHGKLNLWVQLGGHVENDPTMLDAAWREASEESGLADVQPIIPNIFDVDIHEIPANPKEDRHFHYDIRFVFTADRSARFTVSSESKSLAWVALDRIHELTQEESILRMIRKTTNLCS